MHVPSTTPPLLPPSNMRQRIPETQDASAEVGRGSRGAQGSRAAPPAQELQARVTTELGEGGRRARRG